MAYKKSDMTQSEKKKFETSAAGTPGQHGKKKPEKKKYSSLITLLIVCLVFGGGVFYLAQGFNNSREIPISEFVQSYKSSKYSKIEIRDQSIMGTLAQPSPAPFTMAEPIPTVETATLPINDTLKDV